jgi:NACalpha-BTF3-like transcription factor
MTRENPSKFEATVKLHPTSVEVMNLATDAPSIVVAMKSLVDSGHDEGDAFHKILEIGSQVVSLGAHSAGSEKLEASVEQARKDISTVANSFEQNLKKQIAALSGNDGDLAKAISVHIQNLGETLEELTAGEDSPVRESIKRQLEAMSTKLIQDFMTFSTAQKDQIAVLLDITSPTSPLRPVNEKLESMVRGLEGVNNALAETRGRKLEAEKGTSKGTDYETEAVDALKQIAFSHNDEPLATGNTPTRGTSKKGDGVVGLREGLTVKARLVVEAKDVSSKKTDTAKLNYWRKQAEGARKTRGAIGFLGLCKNIEDMPGGHRVYALDQLGQNLVVAYDPEKGEEEILDLAYIVVKMHCLSVLSSGLEINPAAINRYVEESIALLEKFDDVDTSVKAIKTQADKITTTAGDLRDGLLAHLRSLKREVASDPSAEVIQLEPQELESGEEEAA